MTIGEIIEQEKVLGRRMTQEEQRDYELKQLMEIKKYCNHHMWTDVAPYEVVKTISAITVEVRAMKYEQTKFPSDFHPGGFVGHFADNRQGQDYEYSSDETNPVIRIRFSKAKRRWFSADGRKFFMSDAPYRFYDYNF